MRALLEDSLAVATDKAVRPGTRSIVDAVAILRTNDFGRTVSASAASRKAKRSKSTTHTDVHDALDRGYLINRSTREGLFDLLIGDPLPDQSELLPSCKELKAAFEREQAEAFGPRSATVRYPTERENPITTGDSGERSVRSVDFGGESDGVCVHPPDSEPKTEAERALEEIRKARAKAKANGEPPTEPQTEQTFVECAWPDLHEQHHRPHPTTGRTVCWECHRPAGVTT